MPPVFKILPGDCREILTRMKSDSVHCCVTSPPYWGLRDYGIQKQLGLEQSPQEYVEQMRSVFSEVRRVLRPDGTLWLNLGDSYARNPSKGGSGPNGKNEDRWGYGTANKSRVKNPASKQATNRAADLDSMRDVNFGGLAQKQLVGIPWRVAFVLQQDGWYLRQDVIWSKPNPMPESVRDRCTKAHEYLFMLSKSPKYYYDAKAIEEPRTQTESRPTFRGGSYVNGSTFDNAKGGISTDVGNVTFDKQAGHGRRAAGFNARWDTNEIHGSLKATRNKRSVWTIAPRPFKEAHFATFPPDLVEPCILAGCPENGIVLDPFAGAGTTGLVAMRLNRNSLLIDLNPDYCAMAQRRIEQDQACPPGTTRTTLSPRSGYAISSHKT